MERKSVLRALDVQIEESLELRHFTILYSVSGTARTARSRQSWTATGQRRLVVVTGQRRHVVLTGQRRLVVLIGQRRFVVVTGQRRLLVLTGQRRFVVVTGQRRLVVVVSTIIVVVVNSSASSGSFNTNRNKCSGDHTRSMFTFRRNLKTYLMGGR